MAEDNAVRDVVQAIFERITEIDAKVSQLLTTAASAPSVDATPRVQHAETGEWVFDVTGIKEVVDRDTGEPGFWVITKAGKPLIVDAHGIPFFIRNAT